MPQVGRYCNGDQFVRSPVRIASVSPACDSVSRVASDTGLSESFIRNGIMIDYGKDAPWPGPSVQGYHSMRTSGNTSMPYSDSLNIRTPITFGAGAEGSVTMATVRDDVAPGDDGRPVTDATVILTVVAQEPPAGAFRPACCAPSKISHWVEDDLDLSGLSNRAIPSGAPNVASMLNQVRFKQQVEQSSNPAGERIRSRKNHPAGSYPGPDVCRPIAEVVTLMSMNIDGTLKRHFAVSIAQMAIDILERVKQGGDYGRLQMGTGAVEQTGAKMALLVGGLLLGDDEMLEWGNWQEHEIFGEDVQISYVDAPLLAANSRYFSTDLGMPEWLENRYLQPNSDKAGRSLTLSPYRAINTSWQIQAAMAYYLLPSTILEHHGNQAFFDYCDRIMERDGYIEGGYNKWARSLPAGQNAPTFWAKNCWDTYRTAAGMPPVWNWS